MERLIIENINILLSRILRRLGFDALPFPWKKLRFSQRKNVSRNLEIIKLSLELVVRFIWYIRRRWYYYLGFWGLTYRHCKDVILSTT